MDECISVYELSGVRAVVGKHLASFENPFHLPIYNHDTAVQLTEQTIKDFHGKLDGRVSAWAMPFAHAFTSDDLLKDLKKLCDQFETNITLHVTDAVDSSSDPTRDSSIVRLEKLGFHGDNVVLSHCVGINSDDIQSLINTNTPVIVCPTAVLKMGGGFGKKADIVLYETMRPEWRTLFNPINNLVYSADGRSVHTVLVDGRVVIDDHQPTFVDEEELIAQVQDIGDSMLRRTGIDFAPRWPIV